jgi:hypothetical protein
MKKRKYNKRTPRQFMEAIREMTNARGVFHSSEITEKHFGYRQTRMGQALGQLGWTARQGKGTVWVGTRPKDEQELRAMALVLMKATRSKDKDSYYTYVKKEQQQKPKKHVAVIAENPVPQYVGEPVKAKRAPKRKKFSILWGLFKWEK